MDIKVIFSDNGTLIDKTVDIIDYNIGSSLLNYVLNEDSLFIGTILPLNSLYFKMGVVNTEAATISVAYWDGNNFRDVVFITDETSKNGASLGQDGYVTFTPNKKYSFCQEDTVNQSGDEIITGLGDITIYDRFWYKIDFSASLLNTTAIAWIGSIFCTDEDIFDEYEEFNDSVLLARIRTGKTNWESQRVRASELLIADLIKNGIINSSEQILDRHLLKNACVCKTAEVIYNLLGKDYKDDKLEARKEYKSRLSMDIFKVDLDGDAIADPQERKTRQGLLYR